MSEETPTPPSSILDALQKFHIAYVPLENKLVSVEKMMDNPENFSIAPLPGTRILEEYINGGSVREYSFIFQATFWTADDAARLANNEFFETYAGWLEQKTEAGQLPELPTGQTAVKLEALTTAFLLEEGESDTGVYQITCRLEYEQAP